MFGTNYCAAYRVPRYLYHCKMQILCQTYRTDRNFVQGVPKNEDTNGRGHNFKTGTATSINVSSIQKAHFVDIKFVYYDISRSSTFWNTTNKVKACSEPILPIWRKPVICCHHPARYWLRIHCLAIARDTVRTLK